MKIDGKGLSGSRGLTQVSTRSGSTAAAASAKTAQTTATDLQSAVLLPALQALRELPDIDQAKVESIREALERNEIPFNSAKLAALIERYHGGRD